MKEKTLIIYDTTGYIVDIKTGNGYRVPIGIPYLEIEIPEGKELVGVDISTTPHKPVLEDIPKTDIEVAQERIQALEDYILEKETSNITDSL